MWALLRSTASFWPLGLEALPSSSLIVRCVCVCACAWASFLDVFMAGCVLRKVFVKCALSFLECEVRAVGRVRTRWQCVCVPIASHTVSPVLGCD